MIDHMRLLNATMALATLLFATDAVGQDTTGAGAIRGTVIAAGGQPAANVAACVPALGRCTVSDARGQFVIVDLRPGTYDIEVVAAPLPPLGARVEVRAGRDAIVEVQLPAADGPRETVTVTAPRFVAGEELNTSAFLVRGESIAQSAGARQDVSRYVQSLPGVVIGTDDFRNDLIVRGGSPLENLYIVDNVEIPNINAFANFASAGGTVSMLDAELLRDVTFLTGGYPAPYGNRTSSVLQVALREGRTDRIASRVTLGFAGAGGIFEGPLKDARGSWIFSLRRSFLDLFTDDAGIGGVPVLYTLNGKAIYDLTPRDRVWLVNVSAVDTIRLGLTEDSDLSDELSNLDIRYRGARAATGLNWQRTFGGRGIGLFGVSYARARVRSTVRDVLRGGVPPADTPVDEQLAGAALVFSENSGEHDVAVKYDLTSYLGPLGKVQGGISIKRTVVDYDVASPFGTDSPYFDEGGQEPIALGLRDASVLAGVYLQTTRTVGPRMTVTPGVRADRFGFLDATRVAPRVGATYKLTRSISLRGAAGRYYQQPLALFVAAYPESDGIVPFRADHAIGGVTWRAPDGTALGAEVYYKRYRDYPVSRQIGPLSLANVGDTFNVREVLFPITSEGTGVTAGVELFAERQARPGSRWYGQANLALARARHAGRDGILRPASFDYPIVANVDATWRADARWTVSTRVAFLSGRPNTPIDILASRAAGRAIYDTARVNAERSPAYFRLDLRVDRVLSGGDRPLRVFAGVQNVTNRRNFAGLTWDRRSNALKRLDQLGVFPLIGLDWQL